MSVGGIYSVISAQNHEQYKKSTNIIVLQLILKKLFFIVITSQTWNVYSLKGIKPFWDLSNTLYFRIVGLTKLKVSLTHVYGKTEIDTILCIWFVVLKKKLFILFYSC